ncbi:hypothetical protein CC2G_004591 [Coprinopsis cinerea AmutBmut pab1-1]|nr:hypothetical protein CC2G_004591 [Coprinopsis cinerea AmutBmut pab1-1]
MKALVWIEGGFKPWHNLHYKMIVAALLMFVFATLDVAFHLRHNLDAFVGAPNSEYVIAMFEDTSNWINVMKMACYVAQTFVGDSILLYRCWIIYNRRWLVIAFPTLLWIGCTVCGAITIYVEATLDTEGALLNAKSLIPFITSMLCLTLAMNSLTTGLIVHRIWRIHARVKRRMSAYDFSDSALSKVLVVLIESGLMYTTSILILFALYMAGHNGQYGVSNAVVQIIGITFNLIITSVDRESRQSSSASATASRSNIVATNRGGVPLHQIHVQTSTFRHQDDDLEEGASKIRSAGSDGTGKSVVTEWK